MVSEAMCRPFESARAHHCKNKVPEHLFWGFFMLFAVRVLHVLLCPAVLLIEPPGHFT